MLISIYSFSPKHSNLLLFKNLLLLTNSNESVNDQYFYLKWQTHLYLQDSPIKSESESHSANDFRLISFLGVLTEV